MSSSSDLFLSPKVSPDPVNALEDEANFAEDIQESTDSIFENGSAANSSARLHQTFS